MQTHTMIWTATLMLGAALRCLAQDTAPNKPADPNQNGQFLFDRQTFGGNGRTCETCHTSKTGTFSIEEEQARFVTNPNDPLFRQPDSDAGDGQTYKRLLNFGTITIDVPLAPNVSLRDNPSARTARVFRATPTVKNVTTLVKFLMSDGRESSSDLQHQAMGAIHQHAKNTVEPTSEQLDQIAAFEQTDQRFFSSGRLKQFARGGPGPNLPEGNTPSERRGRRFLRPDRQCGICHSGPMLDTSSEFDFIIGPGSHFHFAGAGFQLGPLAQAFDADNNLVLEPGNPNVNQAFDFTLSDGSTTTIAAPDLGRALITGDPDDAHLFKISTLWGIKDTAPYFHDNSARTLEELLDHYNRLFQFINDQVPPELQLELLNEQDKSDLIAFLKLL